MIRSMNATTKAHISETIRESLDIPKSQAAAIVENLLGIIKGTLKNGEDVMISGFGKFCVRKKKERRGRNPATGEDLILRPRKVVTFKCSGKLRDRVNGKR